MTETEFRTTPEMATLALAVVEGTTKLAAAQQEHRTGPIVAAAESLGMNCSALLKAAKAANPDLLPQPGTVEFHTRTGQEKAENVLRGYLNEFVGRYAGTDALPEGEVYYKLVGGCAREH